MDLQTLLGLPPNTFSRTNAHIRYSEMCSNKTKQKTCFNLVVMDAPGCIDVPLNRVPAL
jgi:hypothetical protein